MPRRRRHATPDELVELLAGDDLNLLTVGEVVDRLAKLGVQVDTLVRITSNEPLRG